MRNAVVVLALAFGISAAISPFLASPVGAGTNPAAILRASSTHHRGHLSVTVTGHGLMSARRVTLVAPDSSWRHPLTIQAHTDTTLTATATIAAPLAATFVEAAFRDGTTLLAPLPPDDFPAPFGLEGCPVFFSGGQDTINLQPKDFAFIHTGDLWHLFYIRQHQSPGYTPDVNKRNLGHATSTDLRVWDVVSRNVLQVRDQLPDSSWDNLHVTAPSIVLPPGSITYHMFYTGVTDTIIGGGQHRQHQRIGVATSTDLETWTRSDRPILSANEVAWADVDPPDPYFGSQQFRDPFVMVDPNHPKHWLMYYVTVADSIRPGMVVGVASSMGDDLFAWRDSLPLWNTAEAHTHASIIESPHVFFDRGRWWLLLSPGPWGPPKYNPVAFQTNSTSPVDPVAPNWNGARLDTLYHYLYNDPQVLYWHAAEHLRLGSNELLAAWDDLQQGIAIAEMKWIGSTPDSFRLRCPPVTGVEPPSEQGERAGVRLFLTRLLSEEGTVVLRAELPLVMRAQVLVYDVMGRRRRTLVDRELPAGATEVSWDARDDGGATVPSGVYFVRLACTGGIRLVKVPLLH